MRKFYSIFALCAFLFLSVSSRAADYTIETIPAPVSPKLAVGIPLTVNTSSASSVTQQVFLASELSALGATAGDITGIKFYYGGKSNTTAVPSVTRSLKIYITEIAKDSLELYEISGYVTSYRFKFKNPGTYVYNGSITTEALEAGEIKTLSIPFNQSSYVWDGTKNILLTVFDVTNTAYSSTEANLRFVYMPTERPRFVHQYWTPSGSSKASDYLPPATLEGLEGYSTTSGSTGTAQQKQIRGHLLVPKTTFSITPTIPAPTNLAASSITTSSATLSWDAAAGATSYNVKWGTNSASLDHSATNVTNTYLDIDELEDGTTYYFAVQTVTAGGTSAYTAPANFETTATTMEYKGIDFSKWTSTTTMPTAGAYYLRNDVGLSASVTLTDDLQLCLHGNTLYTSTYHIIVPDGMTLSIFNDTGDGLINGGFMENLGHGGIIEIQDGGTLIICEGQVMNIAGNDSYAIYNNGNLQLSGAPVIAGGSADIYLGNGKVITISGALSNSAPYSVQKALVGDFTSGWNTQMGSANPADYFSSVNDTYGVVRNGNEARMVKVLAWSESTTNSSIGENSGQMVNVSITRSVLTSASYNTICLPFALDDDRLQELFGAGYDLEEFVSSSLEGDVLSLVFSKVTSLEAGKPYLLQPSVDVANPSFEGVTISATSPADQISDEFISFHGTFAPTELTGGNKNLLFLGAGNELFWPASTGDINGFRAYFEVKGAAQKAKAAHIVKKEDQAQALDNIENTRPAQKRLLNGQLVIEKNGTLYNAQGQMVK